MNYQFSNVRIDATKQQLYIDSQLIDVDQRSVSLLIELIQHYPETCSKTQLTQALWPDTVVSDWSISKLVSETRHILKKHGLKQDAIQTLHGRGYRLDSLLGDTLLRAETLPVQANSSSLAAPTQTSNRPLLIGLFTVFIAIAVGLLLLSDWHNNARDLMVSEPADSIGRLLWVDDNPQNNVREKAYLEAQHITVYQVQSTEEALTSLALYQFNVVISDMGRDDEVLAGLNLLKTMREAKNLTPFFLYTIVLTEDQTSLLRDYDGQGIAVEPEQLYQMVLPYYMQN
jgi:DNA-binding winged helix-turn-helix (wHTH) protein/CheY-like chemotaxis protein